VGRRKQRIGEARLHHRNVALLVKARAREVAEMALVHAIPDAVEAAYRRGDLFDKRRKLMDAWDAYCAKVTLLALRSRQKTAGRALDTRHAAEARACEEYNRHFGRLDMV
jgi:hypothetical protein